MVYRKGGFSMKKTVAFLLALCLLWTPALAVEALPEETFRLSCDAAVLMERMSGEVIYGKNASEHRAIASVTKIMTLLLVAEALERGEISLGTVVTASARAASMGGSQVWLREGEQFTVSEMIKCVAVVSANDCAVALAEHLAGSEETFVARMNKRAGELGLQDTSFTNCTGLFENENHYSSAYDVAVMSRELLRHDFIKDYTTIWMDTIRDGTSQLVNSNLLVRHYAGTTGLKTGFTTKAMYCVAASAQRDGTEYIAVVLHDETSDQRFQSARTLMDYAFANYTTASLRPPEALAPVLVQLGTADSVQPVFEGSEKILLERSALGAIRYETQVAESVVAPVSAGERLGSLRVYTGEKLLAEVPIVAENDVGRLNLWQIFQSLLLSFFGAE